MTSDAQEMEALVKDKRVANRIPRHPSLANKGLGTRRATGIVALHVSAALLMMLIAGCSKSLSRSEAAGLINNNERFKEPATAKVPVGKMWFDYRAVYSTYPLQELSKSGVLTVSETGRAHGTWVKEYSVRLTQAGEQERNDWKRTDERVTSWYGPPSPYVVIYEMPVARRKLDTVTGIHSETDVSHSAIAEFIWHWDPTERGRSVGKVPPATVQHGQSVLQRYDDGWRLASVE